MKHRHLLVGTCALVGASVFIGRYSAVAQPGDEGGAAAGGGPDVIVGSLPNISKYGTVGGISAYALGTTSCNLGDEILLWCDTNVAGLCDDDDHPVIAQNLFRVKDGRIEQIGMSWLKHGFCALAETLCGACTFDPYGCNALGIGCSDPYDSSLNGSQGNLGPRSQVNPSTGIFPYPFSAPAAPATIGRRMQVPINDVTPAMNPGALYFGEGHYIQWEDSLAANDNNNASYRRITVGSLTSGSYTLSFTGATFQQKAGIQAWKDHGLGVNIPDPDVNLVNVDVEGDGRFTVGYKVSDNGNGTWHYEYAVYNMNSDRGGQGWFVPVPDGVTITNIDEHIVNHHSGEPYSTAAWAMDQNSPDGGCKWNTDTFATNSNANALRWGTMFNFRFDADQPPVAGNATLSLFKSGAAPDPSVAVLVPGAPPPPPCPGDINDDGIIDGADMGLLLGNWGGTGVGDLNNDGVVDGGDAGVLLASWGDC